MLIQYKPSTTQLFNSKSNIGTPPTPPISEWDKSFDYLILKQKVRSIHIWVKYLHHPWMTVSNCLMILISSIFLKNWRLNWIPAVPMNASNCLIIVCYWFFLQFPFLKCRIKYLHHSWVSECVKLFDDLKHSYFQFQ